MCNTSAKCVIQCKLCIEILDYDWLMNNRVWSGRMNSFVFKSSARPGWRNFFLPNHLEIFSCILSIRNHMIFLVQCGINKHL